MTFGEAIAVLQRGGRVQRAGWNGKDQWLGLQRPDEGSKMSLPYIYIVTVQGDLVPWLASQTDMLAEDWQVFDHYAERQPEPQSMTDEVKQAALFDLSDPMQSDSMLQFFAYEHLAPRLQEHSKPFGDLARLIASTLPRNAERTVALRKLLEAKDCAVRARLYK